MQIVHSTDPTSHLTTFNMRYHLKLAKPLTDAYQRF